jgi:hypothetical protein
MKLLLRSSFLLTVTAIVAMLAGYSPPEASAQCALCKMAVEQAGGAAVRAMNTGILVLLIPPVAIFCTIFVVAYRSEKQNGDR